MARKNLLPKNSSVWCAALLAVTGTSVLVGCSNDDDDDVCDDTVTTKADPDADFTAYKTFAVATQDSIDGAGGAGGAANVTIPDDVQFNLKTATNEMIEELEELGMTQVDATASPDLLVFSAAATEAKDGIYWNCVGGWTWYGWDYYWDPCAWIEPIEFTYTEGSLLVGVADADEEKVVFGGLVQGVLECSNDVDERIEDAVDEIFDRYPTAK